MKTLYALALSGAMILGLAAGASAQTTRSMQDTDYDALTTGRSVSVDRAPRRDADADSIVMGLRVPNGLRTDGWLAR